MNEQQLYIFNQGLKDFSSEIEFLHTLGITLAGHPEIARACHICLVEKKDDYHYQPLIGAPLLFAFDYNSERVMIQRFDETAQLTVSEFNRFLALVDLAFGVIYPLGTIVELDEELLPQEFVQVFKAEGMDFYVVISGRRVRLENEAYIDYIGHLCPYGVRFDTEPLFISSVFVKRVISEGYTDASDQHYCDTELREAYLRNGIYSSIYQEVSHEDRLG